MSPRRRVRVYQWTGWKDGVRLAALTEVNDEDGLCGSDDFSGRVPFLWK